MKAIKYVAWGVGGVLALLLLGGALLLTLFDPNDYKADLQKLAEEQTGRAVSLPGEIRLALWPNIALEFGPATVANAAGFGDEPLLSVQRVKLGVKLWPLLARRLEVDTAELIAPQLRLMVNAAGADNWSGLGPRTVPGANETQRSAPLALSVAGIRLVDGELLYDDREGDSRLALRNWQLRTGALDLSRPVDIDTSFRLEKDQSLVVATTLKAGVSFDLGNERYVLGKPRLALTMSGAALPKAGLAATIDLDELALDLKAQTLAATGMKIATLGTTISGSLAGRQLGEAPEFSGALAVAEVSPRELLARLDIALPATADPAALRRASLRGQLLVTERAIRFDQLQAQLDDATITGSAGISDLERMALAFDLAVNRLNVDGYLEPAKPEAAAAAGGAAGDGAVPLPVGWLRDLTMKGSLRVGQAVFAGIQLTNLRLGVEARNSRLHLFPSEAQLYGGQYSGDITLDASGAVPALAFNERISGVDFAPLLKDWFQLQEFSGKGNFTIKAAARGGDSNALLRALNGTFSVKVDDGAYEGKDLWFEIRRADALLRRQSAPEAPAVARTVFSDLAASGVIENGVFATADLNAVTRAVRVTGRGRIDLPAAQLDLRLNAAVQKIASNESEAANMVGFTVPVTVDGPLSDPRIRPDLAGLAKAAVQKKLDENKEAIEAKKKEVEQQLREKLQDSLKGLFGK